jgi:hypothetical protein
MMGFLSRSNPLPPVDPALMQSIVFDDSHDRDELLRLVQKNQAFIQTTIEPGENILAVIPYADVNIIPEHVFVATDRRVLNLRKSRLIGSLAREDVGCTRVLHGQHVHGRYAAVIETREGMLYARNDDQRYHPSRWMSVSSNDPKIPQRVCAIIDTFYGLG